MDENDTQKNNLKTVRTYMSDMADTVRENEISVIKVALAEQNKHERDDVYRQMEGTPTKKIFWVIGGIILIAGAVYGTYYVLSQKAKEDVKVQVVKDESIISYDGTSPIDVTNTNDLTGKINTFKKDTSITNKDNSIRLISLEKEVNGVKEKLEIKDIFSEMRFGAPSSLVRSLNPLYMLGTYTKNGGDNDPRLFLIFQIKDYEYTYAGMLEWEATLASDMFDLFNFNTKENKLQISERTWKDIIINNKDARVLLNEDGKPILYYMFVDKNNLIITDSIDAIKEIVSRLMLKNIKPL